MDFNKYVDIDSECIEASLEKLEKTDDKLNYLYTLRDKINAEIRKAK